MGPTCEVRLTRVSDALLDELHRYLDDFADKVVPSRKGRSWDVWIEGRPIVVQVDDESSSLNLAAGCNDPEDWRMLEQLASELAEKLRGKATNPEK